MGKVRLCSVSLFSVFKDSDISISSSPQSWCIGLTILKRAAVWLAVKGFPIDINPTWKTTTKIIY